MRDFVYAINPGRVVFGAGKLATLPAELALLALERVMVLVTPRQESAARDLAERIGARCAGVFAGATMHTPIDVTDRAMAAVEEARIDGLVAFGGGSAIGLGKAIALRTDLPQVAIPTTYAGSEMTPILGETADGRKTTRSSARVLPEVVIYDPEVTLTLPVQLSGTSGINAMAHAVEALYAQNRNPVVELLAVEGVRALFSALQRITDDPHRMETRAAAQYGAWLCGTCLGAVGMALHHKLCHTLGGSFDLPHAETHAIVLPHALAYNASAVPEAIGRLAAALGGREPTHALFELAERVGASRSLSALGMPAAGIDAAVDLALTNPYWNPRPLERSGIRSLLDRAWHGDPPAAS